MYFYFQNCKLLVFLLRLKIDLEDKFRNLSHVNIFCSVKLQYNFINSTSDKARS